MTVKIHMLVTANDAITADSRHELLGVDMRADADKRPFGWAEDLSFGAERGPGIQSPVTMFYIEGSEQRILVDTGYDATDESELGAAAAFRRRGIDAWIESRDEWTVEAQLAKVGVRPEQIDLVLHTHLHFDHIGHNEMFSNATFVAQESEFAWATNTPDWAPFYFSEFANKVLDVRERLELIDGETRVNKHVSLVRLGGHTPGSQVVLVDTDQGRVCLAGDLAYYYRNLELSWPGGVFFDLPAVIRAFGWMRNNADIVIPMHDWKFMELYPEGFVG